MVLYQLSYDPNLFKGQSTDALQEAQVQISHVWRAQKGHGPCAIFYTPVGEASTEPGSVPQMARREPHPTLTVSEESMLGTEQDGFFVGAFDFHAGGFDAGVSFKAL